jgi:hypothetical protein
MNPAPKHSGSASLPSRAASWLGNAAQTGSVPQEKAQSLSKTVLFTLLAILVAVPLFLFSTYAPGRLRVPSPRAWIHR